MCTLDDILDEGWKFQYSMFISFPQFIYCSHDEVYFPKLSCLIAADGGSKFYNAWKKGGQYSSSSRAGRLGRTLWPQNSTSVAETEKGGQNSTMTPTTLEKGVNILHQYEKSAKKGGQKSTILKNIGVKILQVWKWGSKFYMLKNKGQNSTMLEKRGVSTRVHHGRVGSAGLCDLKILHPWRRLKKGVKILQWPPQR